MSAKPNNKSNASSSLEENKEAGFWLGDSNNGGVFLIPQPTLEMNQNTGDKDTYEDIITVRYSDQSFTLQLVTPPKSLKRKPFYQLQFSSPAWVNRQQVLQRITIPFNMASDMYRLIKGILPIVKVNLKATKPLLPSLD